MGRGNIIGIDLGTSYSTLSYLDEKTSEPKPVMNKEGELKTPSVVYFQPKGQGVVVGRSALKPGAKHPERFIVHAKRHMGEPDKDWEIDGVVYTPVDISSFILRKLIQDARPLLGPITEAVVTVPAHFTGYQRQLTVEAAQQTGIKVVHILNEPVAAALCFALTCAKDLTAAREQTVLIYDLGGGTFDLSLVRFDAKQLRVLATGGQLRLGGIDWDIVLMKQYIEFFQKKTRINLSEPGHPRALAELAQETEEAKRRLSDREAEITEITLQHAGHTVDAIYVRSLFEKDAEHLSRRTNDLTEELLKAARLGWEDVDYLIPVGGSTRMPMIEKVIEGFSTRGKRMQVYHIQPDLAVSMGAALFAGTLQNQEAQGMIVEGHFGSRPEGFKVTSVCFNNLGLLVRNGGNELVNHVMIPRNTPLPARAGVAVGTVKTGQRNINLKIVEGDAGVMRNHPIVCVCRLGNLPEGLPEGTIFNVELSYDDQGLLQVIAKNEHTGQLATVSAVHRPNL